MSEMQLPDSWILTTFDSVIASVTNGVGGKQNKDGIGLAVSRIETIADQKVNFSRVGFLAEYDKDKIEKYRLNDGDILFSHINSPVHLGKTAIFKEGNPLYHGINLLRIVVDHRAIFPELFNYYCKLTRAQGEFAMRAQHAVNQSSINQKKLAQFDIPLPPLAEQREIADRLDTLLAQVDTLKGRLDALPAILKRFRQSVLAAAVSGKLTEEWRLQSQAKEWVVTTLGAISSFQNGFAFKSGWFVGSGEYQVVKLANIKDGLLKLDAAPAYLTQEQSAKHLKFSPNEGDLLISMTGTRHKKDYGFVCEVTNKDKILVNQRVGRIIPEQGSVVGKFLLVFLRSEQFRTQFFRGETGGVNQGNVGSAHIKASEIALPPIEEQTEIVRRVEQLFAFADQIEQRVKAAQSRVNHLTQSILAKAFRGELTADWREQHPELISGEHSASALLARIKAERAAQVPAKRTRKQKASA